MPSKDVNEVYSRTELALERVFGDRKAGNPFRLYWADGKLQADVWAEMAREDEARAPGNSYMRDYVQRYVPERLHRFLGEFRVTDAPKEVNRRYGLGNPNAYDYSNDLD